MLEVEIDPELCVGSGNCVRLDPECFQIGANSVAQFIGDADSPEDKILSAAQECPTFAIEVSRDGKQVV